MRSDKGDNINLLQEPDPCNADFNRGFQSQLLTTATDIKYQTSSDWDLDPVFALEWT